MSRTPLNAFCALTMGQSPDSESYNIEHNGFPFYQGNADFGRIHPMVRVWCSAPKKLAKAGDILISVRAPIGALNIADCDCCIGRGLAAITPDATCADTMFLFYALYASEAELQRRGTGSTFKAISKNALSNLLLPSYSLEEQKEISAVLQQVDHLISLRQRQAEKLDELVKARFVEMFGDPCEMLHWECKKIEEVADVTVGVVVKPANFYTDDRLHGVKAFRSLNIGEMKVKDNDWVYFSEEGNAQNAKSQLHEGDVLVVRSGAPGTSCVVTKAYEGCNAIDVIIVHVDGIKLNPYYLCAFNNFPHGMRQMLKGVGGAAQKHLNVGKYNQMIVAIPPMKLQNEFVLFMDSVDREKDRIQRSAALLETLKRSLMQQYFG